MKQAKIIINYLLVIGCKNPNKQLLAKTICFSGQFGWLKLNERHEIELVLITLSRLKGKTFILTQSGHAQNTDFKSE